MSRQSVIFWLIAGWLSINQVFAQSGTINGRIYDAISNEPLPFVNVIIRGTTIGSTTDMDGNFIFTGVKPGFVRLEASFIGYQTAVSDEIQVTNAKAAYVEIPMEQSTKEIEEVKVVASPFQRKQESPVSLRSIGISEIENNPGSNRDISKVITSFPGIGTTPLFRNDIIVRGGGPNESRFYLDGVEIPTINHFATQGASGGATGILNADFISSVDYYAGAFPANRGNALSGVFNFSQKDGNKEKARFRATVGASELSLTVDGPMGEKSSYLFSARQSYLQFLFDVLGLPFLPNFNDFQLKSRTRIDEKNEITIVGIGAIDRFSLNTGIEDPDEIQKFILSYLPVNEQWNYTIGAVYKHFRENSYQTFVMSRNMLDNSSYKYPENDESQPKILDYQSREMENKMRFENTSRIKGFKFNVGAELEFSKYTNSTYQKRFTGNQLVTIDYDSELILRQWGFFGQLSKDVWNDLLSLSVGFRIDANDYSKSMMNMFDQFSPRISVAYKLSYNFSINANAGSYYQIPAYTTLGYRDENGNLKNKENDLRYISADHVIAGAEYRPNENSKITLEGFYKQYQNYPFSVRDSINLANKGADFGVIGDEEVTSTGEGEAYGFELMARVKDIKGWNTIFSYTFVRSLFKDKDGQLTPSAWDSYHILTMTVTKNFGKNWKLGAKWRFVGGLPYTPYDLTNSSIKEVWDTRGQALLDYGSLNEKRLGAFHQLDIRLDKQFFFKRWSFMVYLDIQNLYNFQADQPDYIIREQNQDGTYKVVDNNGIEQYVLKRLENTSGTVLPTIGIMLEF